MEEHVVVKLREVRSGRGCLNLTKTEVDHNIRFGLAQRAFFTRRWLEKGEDGKEKTCVGCVDYGLKKSHFFTYSTRCSLDVAMLLKVKYQNTKKYIRLLSGFTFLDFIAQAQTPEQDIILEIQIDPGPSPTTQDGISEEDHSTSLTDTNTSLSSSDNDHSSRMEHGTPIGRRTSSQVIPRPTREVSESEAAKEENAHFIVVHMVLEVLEAAKWTLSFDQWTSKMDTHQHTYYKICMHRHTGSGVEHKQRCKACRHKQCCSTMDAKQEDNKSRHSDGNNEMSHRNTHSSKTYVHTQQHNEDAGNNEHQLKTFSVLSPDTGFKGKQILTVHIQSRAGGRSCRLGNEAHLVPINSTAELFKLSPTSPQCQTNFTCPAIHALAEFPDLQLPALRDILWYIKKLRYCEYHGRLITEFEQLPCHLTEQQHLFSMADLFSVKKGQLVAQARAVLHSAIDHVENLCKACFHKQCFVEKKCPRYARIRSRKETF
ncbi:hypothetical protein PAMA_002802 [Pampus argenteus]